MLVTRVILDNGSFVLSESEIWSVTDENGLGKFVQYFSTVKLFLIYVN